MELSEDSGRTQANPPPTGGELQEEWRLEKVRLHLWSARNHLEAAQTRVEGQHDVEVPVTPSESLAPFARLEMAIYTGTAAEHYLKALLISFGLRTRIKEGKHWRDLDFRRMFQNATKVSPDVDLHKDRIMEVAKSRNRAIHEGRGPDAATAIRNVVATEEFANCVMKDLRSAGATVVTEFEAFDEFQWSLAESRAFDDHEADVRDRIRAAASLYQDKFGGRDAEEVAALVELDREGWLAVADPEARYIDCECPACGSCGIETVNLSYLDISIESEPEYLEYATVDRFFCVACGLDLWGSMELDWAGIPRKDPHDLLRYW
jgi:HEPN domain-containing protein